MKYIYPNYYKKFHCIADKCTHSCCIGWEIDIDDDTYNKYMSLGDDFKKYINTDTHSFVLDRNERCPFLDKNGLCNIITEYSENSLCQICADHPRFRNFFTDRVEIGLGLCCEEVSRLVLNETEKFSLVGYDGYFPEREKLFEIATDRSMSIAARLDALSDATLKDADNDFYKTLERLDPAWDSILDRKMKGQFSNEIMTEQLLCYFLFRHTADNLAEGTAFSVHALRFICSLTDEEQEFIDICRMYSSEIEYSDRNKDLILNKILGN